MNILKVFKEAVNVKETAQAVAGGVHFHFGPFHSGMILITGVEDANISGIWIVGTLHHHPTLQFNIRRPMKYLEVKDANNFLENSNHYLIVHKRSYLQQIDEKLRRIIFSEYRYRHYGSGYLLRGKQIRDKFRPPEK